MSVSVVGFIGYLGQWVRIRKWDSNDFLTDSLMLYIEKDKVSTFSLDLIVDDFEDLKERRVPFS